MCTTTHGTLNLAALLRDPLIQAMRVSDGVSERDYEALMFRVKDTLDGREPWRDARQDLEVVEY